MLPRLRRWLKLKWGETSATPSSLNSPPPVSLDDFEWRERIESQIRCELEDRRGVPEQEMRTWVEQRVDELLASDDAAAADGQMKARLRKEILDNLLGFGILEDLLADPTVTEIMVNSTKDIYIERDSKLILLPYRFTDERHLRTVIDRMLSPLGKTVNELNPYVDGRLPDGSRINVIIPPLSVDGIMLTIRKFSPACLTPDDLLNNGTLDDELLAYLKECVRARKNMVISGRTDAGKTTLLNALSAFIDEGERIITIEDAVELNLMQRHVIRLETRRAGPTHPANVSVRELVRNALRMRPDRIIVGEVRGGEALDMLQAMNTGHDGCMTTVHANSPADAILRIETMALMGGLDVPLLAVRRQIAAAINVIVHLERTPDGKRYVAGVCEVTGMEGEEVALRRVFTREESS